jgi:hypothetical protein
MKLTDNRCKELNLEAPPPAQATDPRRRARAPIVGSVVALAYQGFAAVAERSRAPRLVGRRTRGAPPSPDPRQGVRGGSEVGKARDPGRRGGDRA